MTRVVPAGPGARPRRVPAIEDYLTLLAANLPGPRSRRQSALDEVRDGLIQAVEERTSSGQSTTGAIRSAIAELGSPALVTQAFAMELAVVQARRILLGFLVTGPLVGVWWLLLLVPQPWPPRPEALSAAIPPLPLVVVAVAVALVTLATTGSLIRWLPEATARQALLAAGGVGLGCLLGDLAVLGTLALRAIGTPWQPPSALTAVAVTASLIRVACAFGAILRSRRTLGHLPAPQAPVGFWR